MATFLLDYDGTLCDTLPAISATVQALFLEYGEPVPPTHEIQALVGTGKTLQETLIKLASRHAPERLAQLPDWVAAYRSRYRDFQNQVELFPGVRETLAALHGNARLVLLSNKSEQAIYASLRHFELERYFDRILADSEGQPSKPDARVFTHRLLPWLPDLKPSECIMIGDTASDLHFAKNIGARACYAQYGYGSESECKDIGYDHALERFDDLPAIPEYCVYFKRPNPVTDSD